MFKVVLLIFVLVVCIALAVFYIYNTKSEPPQIYLASFADQGITASELENQLLQQFGKHLSSFSVEDLNRLAFQVLDEMIENKLVLSKALEVGITVSSLEVKRFQENMHLLQGSQEESSEKQSSSLESEFEPKWNKDIFHSLLIEKTTEYFVKPQISIQEEQTYQYWQQHKEELKNPKLIRAYQILVSLENEAQEIMHQLDRKVSFEDLAKEYSIAPEASQEGDLGFFEIQQMPQEFEEALQNLTLSDPISPIVQSPYGWHIFKLVEVLESSEISYEEAYPKIIEILRSRKELEVRRSWIAELKKQSELQIFNKLVQNLVHNILVKATAPDAIESRTSSKKIFILKENIV